MTSLTIPEDTDLLRILSNAAFTARAALSDGTSRVVDATWTSDNSAVATVASGRVAGVASGEATIAADYQGQRATRRIRIVPDYHGRWSGDHRQTACIDDGDWRGICSEFPNGDVYPMTLALTQDRDSARGTLDISEPPVEVRGSIEMPGHLRLEGIFVDTEDGFTFEATIVDWETTTTDNQRMSGRFSVVLRSNRLRGSVRLDEELRSVSKTSSTAALRSSAVGPHINDRVLAALGKRIRLDGRAPR